MFQEAISVADELSTKKGLIKNQRDNRRIRIANYYDKVGTCLEKIVGAMDADKSFDGSLEELEIYVDSFSIAIADIIGFDLTERLVKSLRISFSEENFKKFSKLSKDEKLMCKNTLKIASDRFIDLWSALQ